MNSAESLIAELSAKGIAQKDIEREHVAEYCRRFRRSYSVADFSHGPFEFEPIKAPEKPFENFAFIVETRNTPVLKYVIQNVLSYTKLPVQLYLTEQNQKLLGDRFYWTAMKRGELFVTLVRAEKVNASIYNALLLSPGFWEAMIGRDKALCFQTDSCVCPRSSFGLEDFLSFDYIGSDWTEKRRYGVQVAGGCGGFSLRDVALSRASLERFDTTVWPGGEDDFFAFHIELLGGKVARKEDRANFCSQEWFTAESFACHRVRTMHRRDRQEFFRYCPEAMLLHNS